MHAHARTRTHVALVYARVFIHSFIHGTRRSITQIILHTLEERPPVPLSIHHIPICVSFAFFGDDGSIVVYEQGMPPLRNRATSSCSHGEFGGV